MRGGALVFARSKGRWSEQAVDATMIMNDGNIISQSLLQKNLSMLTMVRSSRSLLQVNFLFLHLI